MLQRRYEVSDEQWQKIKPYFESNTTKIHDPTFAVALIADFKPSIVIADAAYDSDKFREQIAVQGATACIKPPFLLTTLQRTSTSNSDAL